MKCIVDGGNLESVMSYRWDVLGIGKRDIGFKCCKKCGMVIQYPKLTFSEMNEYYSNNANYGDFFGTKYKVSERKEKNVDTLIKHIDSLGKINNVFQVGCSDGYTLSRINKLGIKDVFGIDPSVNNHLIAEKMFSIKTEISTIEEYIFNKKYDCIVLTHILEHLYDPNICLSKCYQTQKKNDYIVVEVPLLDRFDELPPGYFTLEHINYFTEKSIVELLQAHNYCPKLIEKRYSDEIYPVIFVIAQKKEDGLKRSSLDPFEYFELDKHMWSDAEEHILKQISADEAIYIYGAGLHTSQLLANTCIGDVLNISGYLDSSPTKWNKSLAGKKCSAFEDIDYQEEYILISSYASENVIYKYLVEKFKVNREKIVRIYKR